VQEATRKTQQLSIILKLIFKKWEWGDMDWIDLAQNREGWRALLNVAMNLPVPQNAENFLTSRETC
jgi:hypothetical protein